MWPDPAFQNAIDTVKGSSQVVVIGEPEKRFVPVRVTSNQFVVPEPPVIETLSGWVPVGGLILSNQAGTVRTGGVTLFAAADNTSFQRGFIPVDVEVTVRGILSGFYLPVSVPVADVIEVEQPPQAH